MIVFIFEVIFIFDIVFIFEIVCLHNSGHLLFWDRLHFWGYLHYFGDHYFLVVFIFELVFIIRSCAKSFFMADFLDTKSTKPTIYFGTQKQILSKYCTRILLPKILFMGDIQGNALTIYFCFMLICILTFLALSDGVGDANWLNIVHCLGKNDNKIFFELQKRNNFHDFVTYSR